MTCRLDGAKPLPEPMLEQCVTFPIDRGPDLGKKWVRLGKLFNLVARQSMVILCVWLDDSITGLQVYTVADTAKTFEVLPDSRTSKSPSFTSPTEVLQDETD